MEMNNQISLLNDPPPPPALTPALRWRWRGWRWSVCLELTDINLHTFPGYDIGFQRTRHELVSNQSG